MSGRDDVTELLFHTLTQGLRVTRSIRFLMGTLAASTVIAACSGTDVVAPGSAARFSGGSASGGGGKQCTNSLSVIGSAAEALTGNTFQASYVVTSCTSKTRVSMRATELQTGKLVWQSVPDLAGTIAIWGLPYRLTSYRIDATAFSGTANSVVATASTVISTLDALPCEAFIRETATVGYYINWPALWAAHDAQDCGQGGSVRLQITNMNTGAIERDYSGFGMSATVDYEGAPVSYNTPYRVYVELKSWDGRVLASDTKDVVTSPLR